MAGEPHARFGGRGGQKTFPTPIMRTYDSRVIYIIELINPPVQSSGAYKATLGFMRANHRGGRRASRIIVG